MFIRMSDFERLSLILGLVFFSQYVAASEIRTLLYEASQDGQYVPADVTELDKAESLFLQVMQGENDPQLKNEWNSIGFDLLNFKEKGKKYIAIQEQLTRKEGRGFYLFLLDSTSTSVLQAPHSFKDLRTREITLDMVLSSDYPAAAWNTVPRDLADLAHLEQTFFMSFSRAFARRYAHGDLFQLHGYAQEKRNTRIGQVSEFILSSGTSTPRNTVLEAAACLKRNVSDKTYIYPLEVKELGATTNTIGKALRALWHEGFMHIEISRGIRERLLTESKLQRSFINCLP